MIQREQKLINSRKFDEYQKQNFVTIPYINNTILAQINKVETEALLENLMLSPFNHAAKATVRFY